MFDYKLKNIAAIRCPPYLCYLIIIILNILFSDEIFTQINYKYILGIINGIPFLLNILFEFLTNTEIYTINEINNYNELTVYDKILFLNQYYLDDNLIKYTEDINEENNLNTHCINQIDIEQQNIIEIKKVLNVNYSYTQNNYLKYILFIIYFLGITPRIFILYKI